jgi:hypothetical protein
MNGNQYAYRERDEQMDTLRDYDRLCFVFYEIRWLTFFMVFLERWIEIDIRTGVDGLRD